ncbi:MAG: hypothetical protein JZU64_06305, partial [Rhodoferax sp.]|nr:hypothetical protein [Rhodoferax sp.]
GGVAGDAGVAVVLGFHCRFRPKAGAAVWNPPAPEQSLATRSRRQLCGDNFVKSCLSFFEFVHNVRRRGRALLGALVEKLLQPEKCPQNPI